VRHPLQKCTVVQWDIGALLGRGRVAQMKSMSPQFGISGSSRCRSNAVAFGAKRTSRELRERADLAKMTVVRHGRLTMGFASLNPSHEFAAGTSAPH
jgi:hypothetical protein